jgi:hypothetical protein
MRIPDDKKGSTRRLELGWALLSTLGDDAATRDLQGPLATLQEELERARAARWGGQKEALLAATRLRVVELGLERAVRNVARRASELDGRARLGPLHHDLFPGGLNAVIRPEGTGQRSVAEALLRRVEGSSAPQAEALRGAWLAPLTAAVEAFRAALGGRDEAVAALARAREVEQRARDAHTLELERVAGALRTRFPRDREKQDAFWPEQHSRRRAKDEEASPAAPIVPPSPSVGDAA